MKSNRGNQAVTRTQVAIGIVLIVIVVCAIVAYLYYYPPSPPPEEEEEIVFRWSSGDTIMTIDPCICYDYPSTITVQNIYDPLFMPSEEPPFEPIPWVAESYDVSADGLKYTIRIRKGLKFHDGTEITAEDVAFSMERFLLMKTGHARFWLGFVENINVIDDYTVEFELSRPHNALIPSFTKLLIMNKDLLLENKREGDYGEYGDLGRAWLAEGHDAGSGPYMVVSYSPDEGVELVKFEDYWKGWKPNQIDRIIIKVITEEATNKMLLAAGDLDMLHAFLSPTTYLELAELPGIEVSHGPTINWEPICMNTRKPPLDDVHVRRAIMYAIDYEAIVTNVFPYGEIGSSIIPPGVFGHNPNIPKLSKDLDKAREELAQSKYSPEELSQFTLECHWLSGQEGDRQVAVILQEACAEIGINVEVISVLWTQMCDNAKTPETTPHFTIWEPFARFPDPDFFTHFFFHSSNNGTWATQHWFFNEELDELCELQRATIDREERRQILYQIQEIIYENVPLIPVCYRPYFNAHRDYIKGWKYIPYHAWEYWFYRLTYERQ